jgi:PelA/Pel-15E family pectate lyase
MISCWKSLHSVEFDYWIIDEEGSVYTFAFNLLWITITAYPIIMGGIIVWGINKNYDHPSQKYFTQIQVMGFFLTALIGGSGFVYYGITLPPENYPGCIGLSSPGYTDPSINPTAIHYNGNLDTLEPKDATLLDELEYIMWSYTRLQQPCGGFPIYTTPDFCAFYGDGSSKMYPNEFSLQDATPQYGQQYLSMYALEPDPKYLAVAEKTARALVLCQDEIDGGFYYYGKFDEQNQPYQPYPENPRRHSVYDDNVAQGCMSFLLDIYDITHNATYLAAINKGLDGIFTNQYSWGGWPQRTNYRYPEYPVWSTLNDDLMDDMLRMLLKARTILIERQSDITASIEKAFTWLVDVQGNGGSITQKGWAQQYDFNQQPVWARRFEPPAIETAVTAHLVTLFIDMYCMFNDTKYLEPILGAIEWLNASKFAYFNEEEELEIGWSRLYELKTNIPIYGLAEGGPDRVPQYVYDYNASRGGYAWLGQWGNDALDNWMKLQELHFNITAYLTWRDKSQSLASLEDDIIEFVENLNPEGFWIDEGNRVHSKLFLGHTSKMIEYFTLI